MTTELRAEKVPMEQARLLVRHGRWWLTLTDADIERGARAIVLDPHYRAEMARDAHRRADNLGDPVLVAAVDEAWDRLDERDGGEKACRHD